MMKKKRIITILLAVTGIVACQREALQEVEAPIHVPVKRMKVNASWGLDATRTSISPDDAAMKYVFQWEAGDAINLVEADSSMIGDEIQNAESAPLEGSSEIGRFSMEMSDREAGGQLYYTAYYPVFAMPEGKSASWTNGAIGLPLVLPATQHPGTDSFDGDADLLVSLQNEQEERPEELELQFKRIGSVLKLVVTGLPAETCVLGGTLNLGYDSVGEILYNAGTREVTSVDLQKDISFEYDQPMVVQGGSVTLWLRIFSGVADGQVSLVLNAETAGESVTYARNINLFQRRASILFKEGGVTTFSVGFDSSSLIQLIDQTSVPKLYLETQDGANIESKTVWTQTKVKITGDDDAIILNLNKYTDAQIRGRGNTTWTFPKKPYYLKLDKKNNLLGKSRSKKYILLANWMDRTNLRNAVAFEAARLTSMEWAPGGVFVEMYMNGNYNGLYYLCEKIEVEEGRLGADYLFSMDMSDESEWHFTVNYGYRPNPRYKSISRSRIPVEVKYPEADKDETPEAFKTRITEQARPEIENFAKQVSAQNSAMVSDLDSFCDWLLVHSLCVNLEPNYPKSCFMYSRGGKMYAGPVWDFDWGTFIPDKTGLLIENCLFYGKPNTYDGFFQDPAFVAKLKERWTVMKPKFESLGDYIDAQATLIEEAESRNHVMWPIVTGMDPLTGKNYTDSAVTANGDQDMDFQDAVTRMKEAVSGRIIEINTTIQSL